MTDIGWTCEVCGFPATGLNGFVMVRMFDVQQAEVAEQDTPDEISLTDITADQINVLTARWHVFHDQCRPDETQTGFWYTVPIAEVDTFPGLVRWTAHLMEKTWLIHTNWNEVLAAAATGHVASRSDS